MIEETLIIEQTKTWIMKVVVGLNLCPFASKEMKKGSVAYVVEQSEDLGQCLASFLIQCHRLDKSPEIETTIIILPEIVPDFEDYLELVAMAEELLEIEGYEGIYQVASFHPLYLFADATEDDAANFTNRSPYPMLQILREDSIEEALKKYPDPESIPEKNIALTREKGLQFMKLLRESCL